MSANTLLTSVVTGGTNTHTTTAEEANAMATDFVTQGVVGAITLTTASAGSGSFCVNADASPDMGVTIKAGQAYITATPSSQNSQVLRVRASSDYTAYTINANASGSTKYDWIYLSVSATNANTPSADGSNVALFVTSRSSSNSTDNGTPPTYGLLLAIVTVANGASSITNSNITDKRFNTSIGGQAGSLIVNQNGTGTDAQVGAAGIDTNVNITLVPKGTGTIKTSPASRIDQSALPLGAVVQIASTTYNAVATGTTVMPSDNTIPQNTEGNQYMTQSITPKSSSNILVIEGVIMLSNSAASNNIVAALFQDSTANALWSGEFFQATSTAIIMLPFYFSMTSGTTSSTTFNVRAGGNSASTTTFNGSGGTNRYSTAAKSFIKITEIKA